MHAHATVVVGAGHSGLAVSRRLAAHSIDHVVLERSEVADSWRTQRWDSLRLLTPNWMTRLPGFAYRGDDPDGYLDRARGGPLPGGLRRGLGRPRAVRGHGHLGPPRVATATWCGPTGAPGTRCRSWSRPARPRCRSCRRAGARGITTVTAANYRNPGLLPTRRGAGRRRLRERCPDRRRAAAFGAAGDPRRRRARADAADLPRAATSCGGSTRRVCSTSATTRQPDLVRARSLPSMQLVGSPQRATVDLNALRRRGVRLVGRFVGVRDDVAQFSGVAAQRLRARRPQAEPPAGHARRVGRPGGDRRRGAAAVRPDRTPGVARPVGARAARAGSRRSSGPPATAPTCPSWTPACSTARAGPCTTVASPPAPAST